MSKIWSKDETLWSFALYLGLEAVGAGALFSFHGSAGAIVLIYYRAGRGLCLYWPHKALCRIYSPQRLLPVRDAGAVTLIITAENRQYYYHALFHCVFCRIIYAVAITNS